MSTVRNTPGCEECLNGDELAEWEGRALEGETQMVWGGYGQAETVTLEHHAT